MKKSVLWMAVASLALLNPYFISAEEETILPVAEQLMQRQPHWKPQIEHTHPEGTPERYWPSRRGCHGTPRHREHLVDRGPR